MKEVTVIVPAFNEEERIARVLGKLKKKGLNTIVIDDGSTDKTALIASKHATVFSYKPNHGKGFAMRYGASKARTKYVVFFEGDDQLFVEDIDKIVEKLKQGNDLVWGRRDLSVIPWPRRVNNVLTTLALFFATGRVIRDPLSGFIGADRKKFLALGLKEDRFNIESEIHFKAVKHGLKQDTVPIRIKYHCKKKFSFNKLNWKQSALIIAFLFKLVLWRRA